jgi:hypothetical protein
MLSLHVSIHFSFKFYDMICGLLSQVCGVAAIAHHPRKKEKWNVVYSWQMCRDKEFLSPISKK